MYARLVSAAFVAAVSLVAVEAAACGFKMVGDMRPPTIAGLHKSTVPMQILMYRDPDAEASKFLDRRFKQLLERVGHTVKFVYDEKEVAKDMRSGRFDVIIFQAEEEEMLRGKKGNSDIVFVPVTEDVTADLKARHDLILNPARPASEYLPKLDRLGRKIRAGAV